MSGFLSVIRDLSAFCTLHFACKQVTFCVQSYNYHTVPYYDNLLISETEPDIQQLALWNALARMKVSEPKGYALLTNFYFGTYRSVSSFAKANGISRQAMSRKIKRYLRFLRIIAYEELDRGILKTEYGERILSDCCN